MPIGAFRLNSIARYLVPAAPSGLTLDAVAFTSSDYYRHTTTITSATATKQLTMSCWFNVQQKSPRSVVFGMEPAGRLVAGPWIFNNTVDATGRFYAQTLSSTFDRTSSETNLYDINEWVHYAVAIDQTVPVIQMYINGQPLTVSNVSDIDNFVWNDIRSIAINGRGSGATDANNIKVSQVWMSNTFVDLSTNLSKFYDNGPVDLGSNGTATGLAQPLIYHYGDASSFPQNRGTLSYTFTTTGTPTSTTGPSSIAPTTYYFGAVGATSPYVDFYKIESDVYTKLSAPDVALTGSAFGAEFSPDGTYFVCNHDVSPFMTIYKRSGDTFTKLSDPATLPGARTWDTAWDPSGDILYVTSSASPYFLAYSRSGDTFTKIADPSTLPDTETRGVHTDSTGTYVAMCPRVSGTANLIVYKRSGTTYTTVLTNVDASGRTLYCDFSPNATYLSVGLENAPYVRIYKRSGDTFTAISDPFSGSTLSPSGNTRSAIFSPDGNYLVIQQQVTPYNIIFKRSGDTWQSLTSSSDVGTWNGDGANWDKTSTYLTLTGSTTPFIKTYKRSGDTFTAISDPSTLPSGILRDGGFYPGPYTS